MRSVLNDKEVWTEWGKSASDNYILVEHRNAATLLVTHWAGGMNDFHRPANLRFVDSSPELILFKMPLFQLFLCPLVHIPPTCSGWRQRHCSHMLPNIGITLCKNPFLGPLIPHWGVTDWEHPSWYCSFPLSFCFIQHFILQCFRNTLCSFKSLY